MSEWISVDDKLPSYGMKVMVYGMCPKARNRKIVTVAWIGMHWLSDDPKDYIETWFGIDNWQKVERLKNVTHWMKLPKAPN